MSSRRGNSALIGGFVLLGVLLVLGAVILAGGGQFFTRKERAVMHFSGSIYGLQVGAPVVFRGVRLGSVSRIGLVYEGESQGFSIPVVAELEPGVIRGLGVGADGPLGAAAPGAAPGAATGAVLPALVAKGLKAQLSMQSLLTGQLYVDLDLRPGKTGSARGSRDGLVEIPTTPTAIQNLKSQIDGLDFKQLLDDVSAIAGSARAVVAGPQLQQALGNLVVITKQVRGLTEGLNQRLPPLARSTDATLAQARQALQAVGSAAERTGDTAQRLGRTADGVGLLLAPDAPLVLQVQAVADELARSARALREATAADGPLLQDSGRALRDVSQAARALRELADLLTAQPQALLRGPAPPLAWRAASAPGPGINPVPTVNDGPKPQPGPRP